MNTIEVEGEENDAIHLKQVHLLSPISWVSDRAIGRSDDAPTMQWQPSVAVVTLRTIPCLYGKLRAMRRWQADETTTFVGKRRLVLFHII